MIESIDFEAVNIDQLFEFRGISLDAILDAIIDGLDSLVQSDSVLYQNLPGLNKSAMQLFGDGSVDFLQSLKNAVESVRGGNLGSLQSDLNTAFNNVLGFAANPFSLAYQA